MVPKINIEGRGYQFRIDYYDRKTPIEIFIRDEGLISESTLPTTDNKFVSYTKLELNETTLDIKGTAFNVNVDYSEEKEVTRKIIFENLETLEKTEYDLATTTNGEYSIILRVPDNKSKTKAWFEDSINLTNISTGNYAIYISTTVDDISDYGELNDMFYREYPEAITIGEKTYTIKCNEEKRNRLELEVN